ncbi:hypothetical protein EMN47_11625 [Prolixibacteraceae bacterium JC049]|nr:hypothetical protein [Prolixibacteraceae bacterium JC049]
MKNRVDSLQYIRLISGIIIGFILVTSIITAVLIYRNSERHFEYDAKLDMQNKSQFIKTTTEELQRQALATAICLSKMEQVKQAYLQRDSLFAIAKLNRCVSPVIDEIKRNLGFNNYKVHFHKPEAVSFLREWNQTGGDSLKHFRNTVLQVQREQEPLKCIELGRGGFAIRGIAPIFDEKKKLLGSVEVFFEVLDVIDRLLEQYENTNCVVLAQKRAMEKLLFEDEKNKYFKNNLGNYIIIENTLDSIESDKLSLINVEQLDSCTSKEALKSHEEVYYSCMNISDFAGNQMGKIFLFHDTSTKIQETRKEIMVVISMLILAGVFLTIVMILMVRRLSRRFQHINDELRSSMAEKNKIFRIIGHDLKSPFTGLIGLSNTILTNEDLTEEKKNLFISIIRNTVEESLGLLDNLLEWSITQSKEDNFPFGKVNLKDVADDVIGLLKAVSENKDISVENEIDAEYNVTANMNSVHTIFRNLISNAIKFTNSGGRVMLTSKIRGDLMLVSVTDTGIGIDRKRLSSLFRSDVETATEGTAKEKGTGLGLPLVKTLIEKNNGRVEIVSKLNVGTRFTFALPLAD